MLQLTRDVRWLNHTAVTEDGKQDTVVLASKLVNVGYKVAIRTALGGGAGQECFHNLHHEFLIVAGCHQEAIIDCHFRDQFKIGQHIQWYQQVLDCVPEVFVGSVQCLAPLVALVCTEMALAFKEGGAACPPWRQPKSIISKWLPVEAHDTFVRSSQAKGIASSNDSSDNEFSELVSPGFSPSGPLFLHTMVRGRRRGPSSGVQWGPRLVSCLQAAKLSPCCHMVREQLKCNTTGHDKDVWQQPIIHTVKMTGRPLV